MKANRDKLRTLIGDKNKQPRQGILDDDSQDQEEAHDGLFNAAEDHRNEMNMQLLDKLLIRKLETSKSKKKGPSENNRIILSSQVQTMAREMIQQFEGLKSMVRNNFRFDFDKFMLKFEQSKRVKEKMQNTEPNVHRNKEREMLENLERENVYYTAYFKMSEDIKLRNGQAERLRKDNIERSDWIKDYYQKVGFSFLITYVNLRVD